jgi:hypothetical protein
MAPGTPGTLTGRHACRPASQAAASADLHVVSTPRAGCLHRRAAIVVLMAGAAQTSSRQGQRGSYPQAGARLDQGPRAPARHLARSNASPGDVPGFVREHRPRLVQGACRRLTRSGTVTVTKSEHRGRDGNSRRRGSPILQAWQRLLSRGTGSADPPDLDGCGRLVGSEARHDVAAGGQLLHSQPGELAGRELPRASVERDRAVARGVRRPVAYGIRRRQRHQCHARMPVTRRPDLVGESGRL